MPAVSTISPGEVMNYNNRSNAARQNLLNSKATSQYQKALQSIQYGQSRRNFERQANRTRNSIPTPFISRGLFNSGLYRNALSQYAQERAAGLGDMQTQFQLGQQGFTFADRQAEDAFAMQMAQIEAERYARQAQLAAMLREAM
jgi:hypothetical protein